VNFNKVLDEMNHAGNGINVAILDACRDNPLSRSWSRSSQRGLARANAASDGTLIVYSTAPNQTAADGDGRHSPFAEALLHHLPKPDLHLTELFNDVGLAVREKTKKKQTPWMSFSPLPKIFLASNSIQANPVPLPNPLKQQASLTINTTPVGATVFLNGGYLGLSPQTVKGLNTRKAYQLEARLQGYDSVTESVRLQSGKRSKVNLVLTSPGTHLTVATTPNNARVRILNITPPYQAGIKLTPGSYHLEVTAEGYQKQTLWITVSGGNHHEAITLEKEPNRQSDLGFEWATIPQGTYLRGSNDGEADEQPVKRVSIASFKLLKYEVTQKQWQAVMGDNPSRFKGCGANCPVESVSWDDIQTFIQKLNQRTGQYYRLPSEAEWEYAARAGSTTKYSWGNDIGDNNANCYNCGSRWDDKSTAPVDSFAPNKFGLYSMHGNVREWVQDCYSNVYEGVPVNGDAWGSCNYTYRVLRGGSYAVYPFNLRSAVRSMVSASTAYSSDGFRLVQGR
jgi:formylglycine-generating enzyme required for sulfatase activity